LTRRSCGSTSQERLAAAQTQTQELYRELSEKEAVGKGGGSSQRRAAELEMMAATVEELTAALQVSAMKADAALEANAALEARLRPRDAAEESSTTLGQVQSLRAKLVQLGMSLDEMGRQRDLLRDEAATHTAKWGAAAMAASTAAAATQAEAEAEEEAEAEAEEVGASMRQRLEFASQQVNEAAERHAKLAAVMRSREGSTDHPADVMGLARQDAQLRGVLSAALELLTSRLEQSKAVAAAAAGSWRMGKSRLEAAVAERDEQLGTLGWALRTAREESGHLGQQVQSLTAQLSTMRRKARSSGALTPPLTPTAATPRDDAEDDDELAAAIAAASAVRDVMTPTAATPRDDAEDDDELAAAIAAASAVRDVLCGKCTQLRATVAELEGRMAQVGSV
jgi:hypothetical protein